jgi:hypothetical protein
MSTLIRVGGDPTSRGPSATLWSNLVDWVRGTLAPGIGTSYFTDHAPYNAGDRTLSGDSGAAAAVQAERFGVVEYTASQAADAVSGYQLNHYVDLDAAAFKDVCIESTVKPVADNATIQAFVGFTDEALDGFFGSDNTPDGSAIGVRLNTDETVDLIAIASVDTITVIKHELATGVERTAGPHKLGIRVKKETSTSYSVYGSVNGVTTRVTVQSTVIPGAPMLPTVAYTDDNTAAPAFDEDWCGFVEKE